MEFPNTIESKKTDQPENIQPTVESEHSEAVALVEKHRDFFEHYAKGRVKIESAPIGLGTFAFDLEKNTIYINSMFYKSLGLSEEKTIFATLHEIEHFLEKIQILSEEGGERNFGKYLKRIKLSRAFALMDNCVADIRENKTVVSRTNKEMMELEEKIYKEDLFVETDFTTQPKHIQFCQAILRESRVPDEKCEVSPEVRLALDEIKKVPKLMEVMTNPETPMSTRLKLQNKYIWPRVEALLDKDIEEKKKQKQENQNQSERDEGESGENQNQEGEEMTEGGQNDGESNNRNKKSSKNDSGKKSKRDDKSENSEIVDETDPDKIFADEYKEVEKKFPEAVPLEEIEKAFKKWQEVQKGKNSADKADEAYAEKIGVDKKDLQNYRKIVEELEKLVNPETNVEIKEELLNLFFRIISKRTKIAQTPKYPVEEGEELIDPAQLVSDVKSGNLQPKVWQDTEIREKKGDKFGEVEITLVCDRSSSMTYGGGQKAEEQRKSAVLIMEVLKEFAEMCQLEKINLEKPLEIKSEIYSFASNDIEDRKPIKKMSSELGEAERIDVLKQLYDLPGSTTDFNCLEAIDINMDQETRTKIKIGELKKIVIVLTDGGSDNPARVQGVLKNLRDDGVIAIGVGITSEGSPVLTTYEPNALVVEDVRKLPIILGELLKEHLKDI